MSQRPTPILTPQPRVGPVSGPRVGSGSLNKASPRSGGIASINKAGSGGGSGAAHGGEVHRRSAGTLPGLARTASALRQQPGSGGGGGTGVGSQTGGGGGGGKIGSGTLAAAGKAIQGSTTTAGRPSPLLSLPAHLRQSTVPRIPSPLGRGTPGKQKQKSLGTNLAGVRKDIKQSLPVRTSKITQKHVFLPEEPQTKPLPASMSRTSTGTVRYSAPPQARYEGDGPGDGDRNEDKDAGEGKDERSEAEKMTKSQREEARLPRLTAYATADGYRNKLLQNYLKREHGVGVVRVFDDAIYAVYNLPLLPGYGASAKVRSSPAVKSLGGVSLLDKMTHAEEVGYHHGFFPSQNDEEGGTNPYEPTDEQNPNEYLLSSSPPVGQGGEETGIGQGNEDRDGRQGQSTGPQMERRLSAVAEEEEREDEMARSSSTQGTHNDGDRKSIGSREKDEGVVSSSAQVSNISIPTNESPSTSPSVSARDIDDNPPVLSVSAPDRIESESNLETNMAFFTSRDHAMPSTPDCEPLQASPPPLVQRQTFPPLPSSNTNNAVPRRRKTKMSSDAQVGEVIIFDYGVTVFFGFSEKEEREILEDFQDAGSWIKGFPEDNWEVEECHFILDPHAEYPRIYNDMFTFVSHSHLLKLSVSHAIAQSTKLSIYENSMQEFSTSTASLPKELATTGHLQLNRREALTMTGRFFKLRMDINLSSGILDTPELFWSEASLLPLYEAIRDYLEINSRVQLLNDRLAVSGELLEIVHDYIGEGQMHNITMIIIWLIVVACVVAVGEVTSRLIFAIHLKERGKMMLVQGIKHLVTK